MKYDLTAKVTISIYTSVEAETEQEAIEIARDRSIEQASYGAEELKNHAWLSDEYDGEPEDITIES